MSFHSAFERCTARIIYKKDWATNRPAIMRHNKWNTCSSEVLISTPRRFGKVHSHSLALSRSRASYVSHAVGYQSTFASRGVLGAQTFSIAIYCACMALSFGCEVVVFRCSRAGTTAVAMAILLILHASLL